jgi:6-phosphofructokinase 1
MRKRIGVLTGGGDTSALNATLKGIALKAEELGFELIGFMEGWRGVLEGGRYCVLTPDLIDENYGGTLLKSSRTNLIAANRLDEAIENLKKIGIDGLIPIGGDDTMTVSVELSKQFIMASVTKTIDNDVGLNPPEGSAVNYSKMFNYFCPGFPTAASRLIRYVQDLRTTAYSHNRIFFVEAMGRDAGWLTLASAYGHADLIVVPEIPYEPDRLAEAIRRKHMENENVVVVVSEGIRNQKGELMITSKKELDAFGHTRPGGCSEIIAEAMRLRLSKEFPSATFRHIILGHLQRCGSPIALDRDCAIKAGELAVRALDEGQLNGVATIMRTETGMEPVLYPMDQVIKRDENNKVIPRSLDLRFYNVEDYQISPAGTGYFRPIFGDLTKLPTHDLGTANFGVI